MNPKVDQYVSKATKWQKEIKKLRAIILSCKLTEEFKWGKPCYSWQGANVVVILPLKERCALILAKGALLKDPSHILIKPGENTQAARQIRFTSLCQITELEPVLKAYLHEAIEAEKAGLKITYKKITEFKLPEELENKFEEIPALKTAFRALTPGRQRAYIIHFSAAKQSQTRASRVEKLIPRILKGKGMNDP
jgi:uncharacterized protein YdeI (YjbR/CyaY-like superfamily)